MGVDEWEIFFLSGSSRGGVVATDPEVTACSWPEVPDLSPGFTLRDDFLSHILKSKRVIWVTRSK